MSISQLGAGDEEPENHDNPSSPHQLWLRLSKQDDTIIILYFPLYSMQYEAPRLSGLRFCIVGGVEEEVKHVRPYGSPT